MAPNSVMLHRPGCDGLGGAATEVVGVRALDERPVHGGVTDR